MEVAETMGKIKIFKQVCEQAQTQNKSVVIPTYLLPKGENMKGITKRKDGRYMIRLAIDGQKVYYYASTFARAKKILELLKQEQKKYKREKKPVKRPTKKKGLTFNKFADKWLETYKKPFVNNRTFSDIKSFINRIGKELGDYTLKELDAFIIQEYFNKLPKGRTKEKMFTYFNSMLQKACDLDIITKNPFNAVVKDKKVKCKSNAYTFSEQVKILQAIKNTDIEHEIYVYLMCGCRPNELPKNKDFDFENNIINIYGTKNDNAKHRQVEMSKVFAEYMKEYFKIHYMQNAKYISTKFIEICNKLKINKPLIYKLRHTFATNHFTLGTPTKQVQEWLGHSSISMTLDQYTDIDKTATKEKIRELYNHFYYEKI